MLFWVYTLINTTPWKNSNIQITRHYSLFTFFDGRFTDGNNRIFTFVAKYHFAPVRCGFDVMLLLFASLLALSVRQALSFMQFSENHFASIELSVSNLLIVVSRSELHA